jgi:hypothetical protein
VSEYLDWTVDDRSPTTREKQDMHGRQHGPESEIGVEANVGGVATPMSKTSVAT